MLVAAAVVGASATFVGLRTAPTTAFAATIRPSEQRENVDTAKSADNKKMGRPVVHFEIGCRSTAKTGEFYSKLFDWQIKPQSAMASNIQITPGKGIDGHITALGHDPQNYVTVYVEVDDIKAALEKAKALGGKTVVPAVPIPTGHFAWFSDPDGNIVGLLQPKKKE